MAASVFSRGDLSHPRMQGVSAPYRPGSLAFKIRRIALGRNHFLLECSAGDVSIREAFGQMLDFVTEYACLRIIIRAIIRSNGMM
jgi:hypothetical protein